jgi:hypothetical protein
MGSDAGRDFLSTKDPVRAEQRHEDVESSSGDSNVQTQLGIAGLLERIFASKESER